MTRGFSVTGLLLALLCAGLVTARPAGAADDGVLRGVVRDPLGAVVAGAQVALKRDGQDIKSAVSGSDGTFSFDGLAQGRYQVAVDAPGFAPRTSDPVFVGPGGRVLVELYLQMAGLQADVLVTAAATDVQTSQTGVSATVVDAATIDALGNADLLEPLRTVPGVAVVQSGARGGPTALFVRGGSSNFNKVLVDGVPANDIGGSFDFADLATTGVDSVEVLRGSNSVLYGSDAMTSVINIATRRGRTRVPEVRLSIDGGNFSTSREEVSLGGVATRLDYFADYSHFQTDNDTANSDYRNDTFASRVGVTVGSNTQLTGTFRLVDGDVGSPNAVSFYGISDDARTTKTTSYTAVSAQTQITDRWQSTIRFGLSDQDYHHVNPSPTGTPSDSSAFANFLGNVVTIDGANGYSVTGRAILDYSDSYPTHYDATALRSLVYGQTSYALSQSLNLAGGARFEHEKGTAVSAYSDDEQTRNNYGAFAEARASIREHLFVTGGVGVDHNAVFGTEASPRVSVAAYLRPPTPSAMLGDTKITFNAGKGIKEPSVSQELSSLFGLIPTATAAALGVEPVGPERSRTIDVGIEQGLAAGRARVRVAYYNNEYDGLLEFVSKNVLPQIGVPADVAAASGFGAYINAQSNRSSGVEMSGEAVAGPVKVTAAYTYADATVTESFGSGALFPAENPKFPGIRIGQYSPLVGERPFRRPANSGSLVVSYTGAKAHLALAGYFFGKQDDSTFLSDPFFGYSMLLPNQGLDAAYQKFNLSGSYLIHPRLRGYVTIENLFDEQYEAASGFPALPRAVRAGVTVLLGGRWYLLFSFRVNGSSRLKGARRRTEVAMANWSITRRRSQAGAALCLLLTVAGSIVMAAQDAAIPKRIVSTSPSITETLFALDLGDRVVGVSTYCRYPERVLQLPKVGTFLKPEPETIARLRPDLVFVHAGPNSTASQLRSIGLQTALIEVGGLPSVFTTIRQISAAAAVPGRGDRLVADITAALDRVKSAVAGRAPRTVLIVVGRRTGTLTDIIAVGSGSYLSDIAAIAGGTNVMASSRLEYPRISMETVISLAPDVIVDVGEMGESPADSQRRRQITERLWAGQTLVSAVRNHAVYAINDEAFVVPGPRVVVAARQIARWLHGVDAQ